MSPDVYYMTVSERKKSASVSNKKKGEKEVFVYYGKNACAAT